MTDLHFNLQNKWKINIKNKIDLLKKFIEKLILKWTESGGDLLDIILNKDDEQRGVYGEGIEWSIVYATWTESLLLWSLKPMWVKSRWPRELTHAGALWTFQFATGKICWVKSRIPEIYALHFLHTKNAQTVQ